MASNLNDHVDRISRELGHGNLWSAVTDTFYGINHRGTGSPVPFNADQHGLTFFTKPRLNLSYDNARVDSVFLPYMVEDRKSPYRAIRCYLDSDAALGREVDGTTGDAIESDLVDPHNPFIAILTNNLVSISGWPDLTVDTYTSKEGIQREAWSMYDGMAKNYTVWPATANFRNIVADPISLMFQVWATYGSHVKLGTMVPYPDSIIEREKDYETKIYRLVLDPTRRYVRKYAATIAFPTAAPLGAAFNYSIDTPYNRENDQISIPFQCQGFEAMDPILIDEFNMTVVEFNGRMADNVRERFHTKLSGVSLDICNRRGYPRIDPVTLELEWWVPNDEYKILMATPEFSNSNKSATGQAFRA